MQTENLSAPFNKIPSLIFIIIFFLFYTCFFPILVLNSGVLSEKDDNVSYNVLMPYPYYGGEGDMGTRMEKAGKKIGWNSKCFYFQHDWKPDRKVNFTFLENNSPLISALELIDKFKPDFIISLLPKTFFSPKIAHYLTLTRSNDVNISLYGEQLLKFRGYLCVPQNMDSFLSYLDSHGKKPYMIDWYPTYYSTEYTPLDARRLFYCGTNYDPRRSSKDYYQLLSLLDKTGLLDVYGTEAMKAWKLRSYKGELPYDGKSLIEAIKRSGIALVLHSQEHLESGVITGRIFEAAAAGSVIISDRHSFVLREFGDSVLYLDIDENTKRSGYDMFEQVYSHVEWIINNPTEAELMAKRAHAIFASKFTLEQQLQNLAVMHEQIEADIANGL